MCISLNNYSKWSSKKKERNSQEETIIQRMIEPDFMKKNKSDHEEKKPVPSHPPLPRIVCRHRVDRSLTLTKGFRDSRVIVIRFHEITLDPRHSLSRSCESFSPYPLTSSYLTTHQLPSLSQFSIRNSWSPYHGWTIKRSIALRMAIGTNWNDRKKEGEGKK